MPLGLVGSDLGLGRRASRAVHGIGAWVVGGGGAWMHGSNLVGGVLLLGDPCNDNSPD